MLFELGGGGAGIGCANATLSDMRRGHSQCDERGLTYRPGQCQASAGTSVTSAFGIKRPRACTQIVSACRGLVLAKQLPDIASHGHCNSW
jgi:hypothetical protein